MSPAAHQPVVLVTFYSRGGTTETLALSAAVGAVQARGLIRLRRLPDGDPAALLDRYPEHRDTLTRMHREYVPPAEADVLAADALILGVPAGSDTTTVEWRDYLSMLARLGAEGRLAGKVAAVVDPGGPGTVEAFASALLALGFAAPASPPRATRGRHDTGAATALGRQVAETARALKTTAG